MRWSLIVAVVLMAAGSAGAAELPEPRAIRLQLKNDARVPEAVLEESRGEVSRIFARGGLEVIWTDETPRITVKVVSDVLGYATAGSSVMGVAVRKPESRVAQIFLRQVKDFARIHRAELSAMLGHVIAHEVGHLLLPTTAHSPTGLMRAQWDGTQMRDVARGVLTFTDGEARTIRAARW